MAQTQSWSASAIAMTIFLSSPLYAEATLWCPPDPEMVRVLRFDHALIPDGGLVRVGSRIFRNCVSPSEIIGSRVTRLTFNPGLLGGSDSLFLAKSIVVSDALRGDQWVTQLLRGQVEVGERKIGGVVYREFDHEDLSEDERRYSSTFLYDASLNPGVSELPLHSIDCGDALRGNEVAKICSVQVYYMEVRARVQIVGDGPNFPPIQRERFPELARGIADALEILDVTESAEGLSVTLPRFP